MPQGTAEYQSHYAPGTLSDRPGYSAVPDQTLIRQKGTLSHILKAILPIILDVQHTVTVRCGDFFHKLRIHIPLISK